jgi:hypothetical protein
MNKLDKKLCDDIAKNFKKNDKKSFVYNTAILFTNLNLQKRTEISDYLFDQLKGVKNGNTSNN